MKNPNYTAEMTAQIISDYQNGTSVADIAEAIGKSVRSVRSKLVREKDENGERIYIPAEKPVSVKVTGPSKKVLLNDLEKLDPNFPVNGMKGATFLIEASTDLKLWHQIDEFKNSDGTVKFSDPTSPLSDQRFYRVKVVE